MKIIFSLFLTLLFSNIFAGFFTLISTDYESKNKEILRKRAYESEVNAHKISFLNIINIKQRQLSQRVDLIEQNISEMNQCSMISALGIEELKKCLRAAYYIQTGLSLLVIEYSKQQEEVKMFSSHYGESLSQMERKLKTFKDSTSKVTENIVELKKRLLIYFQDVTAPKKEYEYGLQDRCRLKGASLEELKFQAVVSMYLATEKGDFLSFKKNKIKLIELNEKGYQLESVCPSVKLILYDLEDLFGVVDRNKFLEISCETVKDIASFEIVEACKKNISTDDFFAVIHVLLGRSQ